MPAQRAPPCFWGDGPRAEGGSQETDEGTCVGHEACEDPLPGGTAHAEAEQEKILPGRLFPSLARCYLAALTPLPDKKGLSEADHRYLDRREHLSTSVRAGDREESSSCTAGHRCGCLLYLGGIPCPCQQSGNCAP